MKATMESSSKLLILNGMNFRVWEGRSENGVRFVALVNRLEAFDAAQQSALIKELSVTMQPSPESQELMVRMGLAPVPENYAKDQAATTGKP